MFTGLLEASMHDPRTAPLARRAATLSILVIALVVLAAITAGAARAATWSPSWTVLWPTPEGQESHFERGTTLSDGSLVAVGSSPLTARGASKAFVARYDRAGTMLWHAVWTPSASQWATFRWVGRDDCDNIYVVCPTYDSETGVSETALVKYSPAGERLWAKNPVLPTGASLETTDFAVDGEGHSYIVGGADYESGGAPWMVVKVNPGGRVAWTASEDRPGWDSAPSAVTASRLGRVYVTGALAPQTEGGIASQVCATVKYSAAGERLWAADYATPGTWQSYGTEITLGAGGVTVLGGHYQGENGIPKGVFALRYTRTGSPVWQTEWTSPNGGPVWGQGLDASSDGGAVIGVFYAAPGVEDPGDADTPVIAKIAADGQIAWSTSVTLGTTGEFWTVKSRADGTVVGLGNSDFSNVAAAKVAADGALLWADRYGAPDRTLDPYQYIVAGAAAYALGQSWDDAGVFLGAMVKLPLP
jgi:hypothetical protein